MNTIIIYSSKTGFTEKYAQWLKEDLACDCVPYEKRGTVDFDKYQAVAFGSCHGAYQEPPDLDLERLQNREDK
jgi:menaquinone-dependent protoporphyrinogen IX oxidase